MYNIVVILIIIIIFAIFKYHNNNMVYVLSDIDNKYYLVRNSTDKQYVANLLARICDRITILTNHLYNNKDNYPDYKEYIDLLHEKLHNCVIIENSSDSEYTSYSVNKGEQLVFCVHSRKYSHDIHDINLMMYVVLHEISHIACPIYDNHGPLFKKIFAFITDQAIGQNLYTKIDFTNFPTEYCGMTISSSIV